MSETTEVSRRPMKKSGLGRGLGALLGENAASLGEPAKTLVGAAPPKVGLDLSHETPSNAKPPSAEAEPKTNVKVGSLSAESAALSLGQRVLSLDIERIKPNSKQPRKTFAEETLRELAKSIQDRGVIQPILVRKKSDDHYEIIAGERRWRAAQLAGLHQLPVLVKNEGDQATLELALIENLQRENLNPIEEAEAYQHLIRTYGLTQQALAEKIGKDRATVANILRLLGLTPEVRRMLVDGQLSLGHAKVLLAIGDMALQKRLADKACTNKWSVRELERQTARALAPKSEPTSPSAEASSSAINQLAQDLQKIMGSKVNMDYRFGKGKIEVYFYSDEQLNHIVERLKSAWSSR